MSKYTAAAEQPAERRSEEWQLDVVLSHPDGSPIDEVRAVELLDTVIHWAEAQGLRVGGGVRPCTYQQE